MSQRISHRHTGGRALVALAAFFALVLAPSAAFANDIEGTDAGETIIGTPGDDTIDARGGDDTVAGDGDANGGFLGGGGGVVNGGDDTIEGGDGNDTIQGDGNANGGFLGGNGVVNGGNDIIYGGNGDDVIRGDGEGLGGFLGSNGVVNGGNDVLFGGAGTDRLYGDGGNDVLCGEDGFAPVNAADYLEGGEGTDIACAIDDEITVDAGVRSTLNLAGNDDSLDDEVLETQPLRYRLISVPDFIKAVLDELTGVLTFTAFGSGTIEYAVCRSIVVESVPDASIEAVEEICDNADVYITANEIKKAAKKLEKPLAPTVVAAQILPNTGASSDPRMMIPAALALIVGGGLVLTAGRRRTI
ncbi:hypothetical protein [Aeromicrobium sp.]|uniref:hypothetical protein n=1 Tax=Aeromicrobium sp. TaxID=1871063 RepID=UPI003C4941D7